MDTEIYGLIAEDMLSMLMEALRHFNLGDSDIAKEARADFENNIFKIYYNDYLEYVSEGRRPKAKKVPIADLVKWCKQKGIPSDNNTVYAIQQSIYNNGIPSRDVLSYLSKLLDERFYNTYADRIFDYITEDLMK